MPRRYFWLEVGYLVAIGFLVVLANRWSNFHNLVPDPLGFVPLSVLLWGALGAVLIGCYGVFFHNEHWDASFNYWYVARPITGAVLGAAAYLLFVIAIDTTGVRATHAGSLGYNAVAFLVSYSEDTFRTLIRRVTGVLFASG